MITVRNLQKKYGDLLVLKGINAEIKKGEIISVIGPSGTGKSTFLRCLNLLEIPDEGEILIDGISLLEKGVNVPAIRQKTGMVFQSFNLYAHLTVLDNLTLGPVILQKKKPTSGIPGRGRAVGPIRRSAPTPGPRKPRFSPGG